MALRTGCCYVFGTNPTHRLNQANNNDGGHDAHIGFCR